MQQLYLTSSFREPGVAELILPDIEQKLGKQPAEIKISYITTAGNLHPEEKRDWIREGREILTKRGWQIFDYDIEGKTPDEVAQELSDKDVVFVQGGQCIYMLEQLQKCNFAEIIKPLLAQGVIYIGESTGSIVTGQNISPYRLWSKDRRPNPPKLASYQGLGLVNFLVRPHWNSLHKKVSYLENLRNHLTEIYDIAEPMIFLNDSQFIVVKDDQLKIVEA